MNWEYSKLSHDAKSHGGPEKYLNLIKDYTRQEAIKNTNKKWIIGTVPLAFILCPLAVRGIIDIKKKYFPKKEKNITLAEMEDAEQKITEQFNVNNDLKKQ